MRYMISWLAVLLVALFLVGCTTEKESAGVPVTGEPVLAESEETEPEPAEEVESTSTVVRRVEVGEETGPSETVVGSEADQVVLITANGFDPSDLTIQSGDTVEWVNKRDGRLKALVVGDLGCREVRSPTLVEDESFTWTFDEAQSCVIREGITTSQTMTIVVE